MNFFCVRYFHYDYENPERNFWGLIPSSINKDGTLNLPFPGIDSDGKFIDFEELSPGLRNILETKKLDILENSSHLITWSYVSKREKTFSEGLEVTLLFANKMKKEEFIKALVKIKGI